MQAGRHPKTQKYTPGEGEGSIVFYSTVLKIEVEVGVGTVMTV